MIGVAVLIFVSAYLVYCFNLWRWRKNALTHLEKWATSDSQEERDRHYHQGQMAYLQDKEWFDTRVY